MKLSIITPTYNSATTLPAAIASVLSQQGAELEYLIIDGVSTDGTLEVIKHAAARDKRIRWISEPDHGIADAFNKGLRLAGGDWIGIINSDDAYAPGALEAVAATIRRHRDADVIHGDLLRIDEHGKPLFLFKPADLAKTIWHKMPISHPTTFVARTAYARVGEFNTRLKIAMDYDLILRLHLSGASFCYVDRVLAHMRSGGVSDTDIWSGLRELRAVSMTHGYGRFRANSWFLYNGLTGEVKRWLCRAGLHRLLTLHPRFKKA
jgi:glycosyltransferase involved in cell wall biosynthesis